jgi:hypothetical protein
MNEAVEIAKLRLFLKMVGAVDINIRKPNYGLEPLPDVDFNIRAGNTLVGFASEDDFKNAVHEKESLFAKEIIPKFEDEFVITAKAFKNFQDSQLLTDKGEDTHKKAKVELQKRLDNLNERLNEYLASTYGIDKERQEKKYTEWLESHQPFHWFAEFYEIINGNGGFDVVIGNPPYVQISDIGYSINNKNADYANLYAFVQIRCKSFMSNIGHAGLIVPMSITSIRDFKKLRETLLASYRTLYFTNHSIRPLPLFTGISQRVSIVLSSGVNIKNTYSYTTFYLRTNDSNNLLKTFTYENTSPPDKETDNLIPKLGNLLAKSIWLKLKKKKSSLINTIGDRKSTLFFKDYGETYWVFPFKFSPYLTPLKSFKELSVDRKYIKKLFCSYNSSAHYFYYSGVSDCWHFGSWHLNKFPIDFTSLSNEIGLLASELEKSFKSNRITRYDKRAGGDIYEYKISRSKPIIDQIDTILAQHYGFTEEELDFIINYDIKYRMGKELDAYIEGTLGKENIKTRE